MINALRTGAYISQLRKARDWTQLELAEKLHITHQAVSQWEKGAAFPDIGLLPALARLLGVSVDDLLNGEPVGRQRRVSPGQIVEGLAYSHPRDVAHLVQHEPEGPAAMVEAAPLARPSQLGAVIGHVVEGEGEGAFTLEQLIRLAPFISAELLEALLDRAAPEPITDEALQSLAPFVGEAALDRLVTQVGAERLSLAQVTALAPFLKSASLGALVFHRLDAGDPPSTELIEELAPFLDADALDELLRRLPAGPLPIDFVVSLAPHVGADTLDRLLARLDDPAAIARHLENLAPFLSRAALTQAVRQHGPLNRGQLLDLAPFLERETLEALLQHTA